MRRTRSLEPRPLWTSAVEKWPASQQASSMHGSILAPALLVWDSANLLTISDGAPGYTEWLDSGSSAEYSCSSCACVRIEPSASTCRKPRRLARQREHKTHSLGFDGVVCVADPGFEK